MTMTQTMTMIMTTTTTITTKGPKTAVLEVSLEEVVCKPNRGMLFER